MSGKRKAFVVAVAAAGMFGLGAPAASADSGLVNVSHNQVPVQACNNHVPLNGVGVQVPVDDVAGALGILSPGDTKAKTDSSCHQASAQDNGHSRDAGLINVSHNQVPVQVCNNHVPGNAFGVQVPADDVAGAAGVLSRGDTKAKKDSSCHQRSAQAADGTGYSVSAQGHHGHGHHGHLGDAGLINVSHNQVPVQVCNNHVPVNVVGVQVPVSYLAGALSILSPGNTVAWMDSSCHQGSAQDN